MRWLDEVHPERGIDGFTRLDGTVRFFSFVRAIQLRHEPRQVLDFGAGRGAFWEHNAAPGGSLLRRHLQDLRFGGARVVACDVDPVVREHPCSDEQVVLEPDAPLPFPDAGFDLIVSDFTFEHIQRPEELSRELMRILRPGGHLCARTPNAWGYVRIPAQLVPNRLHAALLSRVQPGRQEQDVFPTVYRMNDVRTIRRLFPGAELRYYRDSAEPAYFFGSRLLYRLFGLLHGILPDALATTLCVFLRKPLR